MIVQSGPFAGMVMSSERSWSRDGDITPKLLGVYEQELHRYLIDFASQQYDAIVDIGCAEGYYAIGLARMFPNVKVYAYDTNEKAAGVLRAAAHLNNVSENIVHGDFCTSETLAGLAEKHSRMLVICDCEGYEAELFRDPKFGGGALRHSDLIVECHDFKFANCTSNCMAALAPSHMVENVYSSGRNPNAFPFLAHLSDLDRWVAICENRRCLQNWIVARARKLRS